MKKNFGKKIGIAALVIVGLVVIFYLIVLVTAWL
jgi:tetrahydromethanopterin S-methyltransferase subunit G